MRCARVANGFSRGTAAAGGGGCGAAGGSSGFTRLNGAFFIFYEESPQSLY